MWLAATVSTLQPHLCPCRHDVQRASLGARAVGSNLYTLGYRMPSPIIQGISHSQCWWQLCQYIRTQGGRGGSQGERILLLAFLVDAGCCLTVGGSDEASVVSFPSPVVMSVARIRMLKCCPRDRRLPQSAASGAHARPPSGSWTYCSIKELVMRLLLQISAQNLLPMDCSWGDELYFLRFFPMQWCPQGRSCASFPTPVLAQGGRE